jgi:hypothetical protein
VAIGSLLVAQSQIEVSWPIKTDILQGFVCVFKTMRVPMATKIRPHSDYMWVYLLVKFGRNLSYSWLRKCKPTAKQQFSAYLLAYSNFSSFFYVLEMTRDPLAL